MRLDRSGNPYLIWTYYSLSVEEKYEYFRNLASSIYYHKCLYYIFDAPKYADFIYDRIERTYEAVAEDLGLEPEATNMVGFDERRPECQKALKRCQEEQEKKDTK